ncbi:MAG: hypothetical protein Q8L87_11895 [Anaerolineales bacterium]|nr:hypothetical protein [Anaerolineales bacterium]
MSETSHHYLSSHRRDRNWRGIWVALDNMAVGIAIGAAYGIGTLPVMLKKQQRN